MCAVRWQRPPHFRVSQVFQRRQQREALLFAAADLALALAVFQASYWMRTALPLREFYLAPAAKLVVLAAAAASVSAAGWATRAYARLAAAERPPIIADTLRQGLAAAPGLLTLLYLLNLEPPVSRLFLALFFVCLASLQIVQRSLAERFRASLRRAAGAVTSLVVVGSRERAIELAREMEASERHGLRLLALVDCDAESETQVTLGRAYPVHPLSALPRLLTERPIDEVALTVPAGRLRALRDVIALCDEHGVTTRVVADFFPHAHSRVHLDRFGELPMLTFSITPASDLQLFVKRISDALLSAAALVVLSAPMLAVAALVKLTSRGPVLFRQRRCGLNGRLFTCYKFRSMVVGAESRQRGLEHLNEKDGPAFKIREDPRLTPVGALLRRFSIDEWPQFWNVLKGDMSIVGPRPAVPAEVSRYETWQRRRLRMRPGLTCLWAVRGRDDLGFDRWMQMDLEYIDRWSLLLDLQILARTVPVVLAGKGAH